MPPRRKLRLFVILGSVVVVLLSLAWTAAPYVAGAAFVIDLSGQDVALRRWLPVSVERVETEDLSVPTRHGAIEGRLYRPARHTRRTALVVPGLHTAGVEEPRLTRLATRLAGEGINVLSLPLPDLRQFRVTPRSTDMIEDAVRWLSDQRDIAPDRKLTLVGVSFGGGLSLVAAGRSALVDRLDMVISVGGHGDLPRVINYLCTGRLPDGTVQPANDYGAAIVLLGTLPLLVPAEQVAPLEQAVRMFLDASVADGPAPEQAAALFAESRRLGEALPEPARAIIADVSARDVMRLGPRLVGLAELTAGDPALSPERSPATLVQVLLVHGVHDTVIPQTETPALASYLAGAGNEQVSWLLTPAISHANAAPAVTAGELWTLVRFWTQVLK